MPPSPRHVPVYRAEHGASGAKDISTFRERETYVIIGRGFAAVANHLTLRASTNPEVRARVDRCRFVIIGGDEPWKERGATPLGQFPHMLRLPAYQALGGGRAYAQSDAFGGYIRDAEKGLSRFCDQDVQLGTTSWVGLIETYDTYEKNDFTIPEDEANRRKSTEIKKIGPQEDDWKLHPGMPYRLSVYWRESPTGDLNLSYLYAHYVDVCTGLGPSRLLHQFISYGPGLYEKFKGEPYDQTDYSKPKPLIVGEHHIGAPLPTPTYLPKKEGENEETMARILVYGANPSAAWSAEHVLNKSGNDRLHWCADPKRDPNKAQDKSYDDRNEAYFMHPSQANPAGGRNTKTVVNTKNERFLATITGIEKGAQERLKVTFSVPKDATGWRADEVREYDQVVISAGQENIKKRAGSAAYLVQSLGELTPIYAADLWNNLQDKDKTIPVGLTDGRGHVRILGSASVAVLTTESKFFDDFNDFYKKHSQSLPQEGRAGGNSLLMATTTVELANRFMPARLDANHACQSLIQRLVGTADVAAQVVKARQDEGFRLPPTTPDSERYLGKGFLTRGELKSVIGHDETLSKFTPQA